MQRITSPQLLRPHVISVLSLQAPVGQLRGHNIGNFYDDVALIQTLLNFHAAQVPCRARFAPLRLDGRCGPLTCRAITLFQQAINPRFAPDGVIEPGKATWQALTQVLDTRAQQQCAARVAQAALRNPLRPHNAVRKETTRTKLTRVAILEQALRDARVQAFLELIAIAEGTLIDRVQKGGAATDSYHVGFNLRPIASLQDHPRIHSPFTDLNHKLSQSDAAGKYQFLSKTWDPLRDQLGLPDFGPHSQDLAAVELMSECQALKYLQKDQIDEAIHHASQIWASFPVIRDIDVKGRLVQAGNSRYAQRHKTLDELKNTYRKTLLDISLEDN